MLSGLPVAPEGSVVVLRLGDSMDEYSPGGGAFMWNNLPCPHEDSLPCGRSARTRVGKARELWGDWKCAAISEEQLRLWWSVDEVLNPKEVLGPHASLYAYVVPKEHILELEHQTLFNPARAVRHVIH